MCTRSSTLNLRSHSDVHLLSAQVVHVLTLLSFLIHDANETTSSRMRRKSSDVLITSVIVSHYPLSHVNARCTVYALDYYCHVPKAHRSLKDLIRVVSGLVHSRCTLFGHTIKMCFAKPNRIHHFNQK